MKGIKRRDFCKVMPAAIGLAACPCLLGTARVRQEEKMDKKVKHIEVKVASVKGTCALQKVGDTARITEQGVDGKICIHALYSLLPAAFAMLYGVRFPWLSDPDKKTHACPDAANPVVYEITRVWES